MTVRGRACMRVCAFMNWFINYVMMESMKYIITSACLSVFLYLPIYIRTHTHTHTYLHLCVCVFGCSHIRRRKEFYLSKALTHKKIDRLIDSRYIYR